MRLGETMIKRKGGRQNVREKRKEKRSEGGKRVV